MESLCDLPQKRPVNREMKGMADMGWPVFSTAVSKYLHVDLNLYIPLLLLLGGLTVTWRYFSEYFSGLAESHLMSTV